LGPTGATLAIDGTMDAGIISVESDPQRLEDAKRENLDQEWLEIDE
jgi:hypothetical protein